MAEEVSGENEPEAPNAALAINLIGAPASKLSGTSTTKRKYVDSFSDDFKGSNPCPSPKVSIVFSRFGSSLQPLFHHFQNITYISQSFNLILMDISSFLLGRIY